MPGRWNTWRLQPFGSLTGSRFGGLFARQARVSGPPGSVPTFVRGLILLLALLLAVAPGPLVALATSADSFQPDAESEEESNLAQQQAMPRLRSWGTARKGHGLPLLVGASHVACSHQTAARLHLQPQRAVGHTHVSGAGIFLRC